MLITAVGIDPLANPVRSHLVISKDLGLVRASAQKGGSLPFMSLSWFEKEPAFLIQMRGGRGWGRPRERLTRYRQLQSRIPVFDRCDNLRDFRNLEPGVRDPACRTKVRRGVGGIADCLIRSGLGRGSLTMMEWPMLTRLHPSLVPGCGLLLSSQKCLESVPDPRRLFLLLWRLKPCHPPSST